MKALKTHFIISTYEDRPDFDSCLLVDSFAGRVSLEIR